MAHDLRQFDSIGEVVMEARKSLHNGMESNSSASGWNGNVTLKGALDLAGTGWDEYVPEVKRLTAELEHHFDNATVNTFDAVNDVFGSVVDMGKFLTGEPECMIDFTPVKLTKVGRVVGIHVNVTHSASIDAKLIIARGAAITALVDLIERTGNVVEITAESVTAGYTSKDALSYKTVVKHATEPMELSLVLFVLAHPAWLRKLMFAVMEQEPAAIKRRIGIGSSYGSPQKCVQAPKDSIVIESTRHGDDLNGDPKAWIEKNLSDLGLLA